MELNYSYMQYTASVDTATVDKKKYEEFKERISRFNEVDTVEEARTLAKEILPTVNEISILTIGNAKCVIVNRSELYRITLDNQEECICYDFISPDIDVIPEELCEIEEL